MDARRKQINKEINTNEENDHITNGTNKEQTIEIHNKHEKDRTMDEQKHDRTQPK